MKAQSEYLTDYREFCKREFVIHEKILTRQDLHISKDRCSTIPFETLYNQLKRKYIHEAVNISIKLKSENTDLNRIRRDLAKIALSCLNNLQL